MSIHHYNVGIVRIPRNEYPNIDKARLWWRLGRARPGLEA